MTASDDDSEMTGTYWVHWPGCSSSWYPNQANTTPSRIRPAVGAQSAAIAPRLARRQVRRAGQPRLAPRAPVVCSGGTAPGILGPPLAQRRCSSEVPLG